MQQQPTLSRRFARWGAARLGRRLAVSMPLVGAAFAFAALRAEAQRKGLIGGAVETLLNATPYVGALKNAVELFRGDFIPDRQDAQPRGERKPSRSTL